MAANVINLADYRRRKKKQHRVERHRFKGVLIEIHEFESHFALYIGGQYVLGAMKFKHTSEQACQVYRMRQHARAVISKRKMDQLR